MALQFEDPTPQGHHPWALMLELSSEILAQQSHHPWALLLELSSEILAQQSHTATLDASTLFPALPMSIMKIPPTIKIVTMLSTQDRSLRRIRKDMFDEINGIHLTSSSITAINNIHLHFLGITSNIPIFRRTNITWHQRRKVLHTKESRCKDVKKKEQPKTYSNRARGFLSVNKVVYRWCSKDTFAPVSPAQYNFLPACQLEAVESIIISNERIEIHCNRQ